MERMQVGLLTTLLVAHTHQPLARQVATCNLPLHAQLGCLCNKPSHHSSWHIKAQSALQGTLAHLPSSQPSAQRRTWILYLTYGYWASIRPLRCWTKPRTALAGAQWRDSSRPFSISSPDSKKAFGTSQTSQGVAPTQFPLAMNWLSLNILLCYAIGTIPLV